MICHIVKMYEMAPFSQLFIERPSHVVSSSSDTCSVLLL